MAEQWLTLELTPRGEQEDPDLVSKAIRYSLKNAEVFVPAAITQIGGDRVIHRLIEGYAFVRMDRRPVDYFKLECTKYVQSVMVRPGSGSRHLRVAYLAEHEILRMQDQIRQLTNQGIGIGDVVQVMSGPYRNITATVLEDIPETGQVQVLVSLLSKQSLVMLPRSFLTVVERAPYSAIANRLGTLCDWATVVSPVLSWEADVKPLLTVYDRYAKVEAWRVQGQDSYTISGFEFGFDQELSQLRSKSNELEKVSHWKQQAEGLFDFVASYYDTKMGGGLENLQSQVVELLWLDDLMERIRTLWDGVEDLSREFYRQGSDTNMVQNVIVDGHNLAFRCLYAPGMSKLTDRQGRPTGATLGFLRSLGALKKRFPGASLHVVWDGSSQRRKLRFGEYKAQRPAHEGEAWGLLKNILPLLGVPQVWNPAEEADDVIATLVRGPLCEQENVIYSNDKDFLQLVTSRTRLLVPPAGSRNEILYGVSDVVKALGVSPDKVVHLRSLYGDTSDNIPGVPRVPKKTLKALLQAHGSIQGIYRSGLAGVSKSQYERLQAAEPQVRINIELMTLYKVDVVTVDADADADAAVATLQSLDIDPDPLISTFFG